MHKKTLAIIISMLLLSLGNETSLVAAKTNQYNHDYIVVYNAQNQKSPRLHRKKASSISQILRVTSVEMKKVFIKS